jgi:hypothetical protein
VSVALDRLVAERVFGWTVVASSDGEPIWSNDCGTPLAFQYASAPVKFGPNFSTEIAAAWEVVEHLRKQTKDDGTRKWLVSIIDKEDGLWECVIYEIGMYDVAWEEHASPAMAICIAALRLNNVPEATIQEACK